MSVLKNILVQKFLDDMVKVGATKWGSWTLMLAILTYALMQTSILPYDEIAMGVMTANLAFATVVTVWWQKIGREKHGINLLDIADQMAGQDQ